MSDWARIIPTSVLSVIYRKDYIQKYSIQNKLNINRYLCHEKRKLVSFDIKQKKKEGDAVCRFYIHIPWPLWDFDCLLWDFVGYMLD